MAIVKFRKPKLNKKEKATNSERIDYKERIKNHRATLFYRGAIILVVVLAVFAISKFYWNQKVFLECFVTSGAENVMVQNNQLAKFDGKILAYGKDGAGCIDTKGNSVWNITYEMQNPMIDMNGPIVAIGDFNARTIYLLDSEGSIGEITTTMPIYKFCVSQTGVMAVVLNDGDITWIYLYDKEGNQLAYFKTTMQKSGFPIDVTISPNGQLVGVSYLYVNGGEMKTSIAFYNFGGVGQNETDNYVSGYDYLNIVVPNLQFMDGKTAFAVSDDRLMFFSGNQKPVSVAEHLVGSEINSVYYNENYVGVVFVSDSSEARYRLEIYDKSGQLKTMYDFDMEYNDIILSGNSVFIYNESKCLIGDMNGDIKYQGELSKSARLIIPSDRVNKFTVVSTTSIDGMELR